MFDYLDLCAKQAPTADRLTRIRRSDILTLRIALYERYRSVLGMLPCRQLKGLGKCQWNVRKSFAYTCEYLTDPRRH